jgi:hypothetical protein
MHCQTTHKRVWARPNGQLAYRAWISRNNRLMPARSAEFTDSRHVVQSSSTLFGTAHRSEFASRRTPNE